MPQLILSGQGFPCRSIQPANCNIVHTVQQYMQSIWHHEQYVSLTKVDRQFLLQDNFAAEKDTDDRIQ